MALRFYNTLTQQVEPFSRSTATPCACTRADPRSTTTPTSATSAPSLSGHSAALAALSRLPARPRHEHHRRGRQDHPQRRGRAQVARRIHRRSTRRRFSKTAPRCACERPERMVKATEHIPEMVARHRRTGRARLHLRERRLGLLPHLEISRDTASFAQRFQRHPRRRARGRGRIRQSQRARFRFVEGAQGRRALLGERDRPGPARLAHRMLRDGDEVSGRDAGHPRRRRRPDLPASRERDRAIGGASPPSRSRASGCIRSF